jgi:hypothetical protein
VDLFVKMDVEGARLTPEGWHRADALFAKHGKASQPKVLIVIASRYAVSEKMRNENTAEYYMGYEEVGRIDISSLRFSPSNGGIEMRSFDKYIVVLTDSDQIAGADRSEPAEWRIEGGQPVAMHVTAETAIHFVTRMNDKTTDHAIKKNAQLSLAKLSRFR